VLLYNVSPVIIEIFFRLPSGPAKAGSSSAPETAPEKANVPKITAVLRFLRVNMDMIMVDFKERCSKGNKNIWGLRYIWACKNFLH
ncbi:MAG: hypothetical protein K2K84_03410, partial [Muribaculaceae bacterium]|nr:hypothetical protein [Muribaculaceae bacterium]